MAHKPELGLPRPIVIVRGAFVSALLPMVIIWSGWVLLATLGGYPGVICLTPMAWLMALWSGMHYATLTAGASVRCPLLAPALIGAGLGFYLGLTFVVVGAVSLTASVEGDELTRIWVFSLLMLVVSVPICAGLSVFTAWLVQRRTARAGR